MAGHIKSNGSLAGGNIRIVRIFLVIFFSVGVSGIIIPYSRDFFIHLTPLALIISFISLAAFHQPVHLKKELLVFSTIFLMGFVIEAVGVNTGKIFGSYTYGKGLGIKLFNTPLVIGLNWVMLIYCSAAITNEMKMPVAVKILTASLLMVFYDAVMEQVAPGISMWNFSGENIPLSNYAAWFIIAILLHLFLRLTKLKIMNRMAGFVFIVQSVFFIILGIYFKFFQ